VSLNQLQSRVEPPWPPVTSATSSTENRQPGLRAGIILWVGLAAFAPRRHDGQPGAILRDRDGKVLNTLALDILDGRVQAIRSVINPDKLGHLGPVADAWAVIREANQARRPTN
jgi:hypothetical protein